MTTPEILQEISALRQKIQSGNYTQDDFRRAVALMAEGRVAAQTTSSTSRTRKATAAKPVDTASLFDAIEKL